MERRALQVFFAAVVAAAAALTLVSAAAGAGPRVLVIEFENDVNPVTQDYVVQQLDRAEEEGYTAVVIELDTPGGLSEAMRKIYQRELASKIPVIVYVAPNGARAASAGVWIGQAADILAMAPQTNLGSSTPISAGGGEIPSDLKRKVVNDAAASLRALAEEHGRNADWAERAVRKAANINARKALELNVIDAVAPTLPALLEQIDGRKTKPKGFVLRTAGAEIDRVEMGLWKRILDLLVDPNVLFLLTSIGLLGLIVELWHPGLIFPGTVGAISLIVSLYGFQVLPVSWAGVLLIVLAAAFIGAEPFVVSHGALSVAGAVCFLVGALMLFDPAGPAYQVSLPLALGVAGTLGVMTALLVVKIVQIRRKPVEVGMHSIVGARGEVRPSGLVFVNGELWRARSIEGAALEPGEAVEVTDVEGLTLVVRPATT